MAKIIATGIYFGRTISVEAVEEDGSILLLLHNEFNEEVQRDFEQKMKNAPSLGNYYPSPDTMLAAFSVLQNSFFDELKELKVEGTLEEIPYEKGMIY